MKTRLLMIIGITVILVGGFVYLSYIQYTHYETWANNEHWYYHPDGYTVECEIRLFQYPSPCKAIDEYGNIVDTKTGLVNWTGVIWLGDSDFCEKSNGIWNDIARGCYGLYDMCEKDGGIPRFLKKSLPFPDIEENKPINYLMDCYYAYTTDDTFSDESVFTDTSLLNDTNDSENVPLRITDEDLCGKGFVVVNGICENPDYDNFDTELNQIFLFVFIGGIISGIFFVIIWRKRK